MKNNTKVDKQEIVFGKNNHKEGKTLVTSSNKCLTRNTGVSTETVRKLVAYFIDNK